MTAILSFVHVTPGPLGGCCGLQLPPLLVHLEMSFTVQYEASIPQQLYAAVWSQP